MKINSNAYKCTEPILNHRNNDIKIGNGLNGKNNVVNNFKRCRRTQNENNVTVDFFIKNKEIFIDLIRS